MQLTGPTFKTLYLALNVPKKSLTNGRCMYLTIITYKEVLDIK